MPTTSGLFLVPIQPDPAAPTELQRFYELVGMMLNTLQRSGYMFPVAPGEFVLLARFRHGSGAPAGSLGYNGDYYLDADATVLYTRAAGSWSVVADLGGTGGTGLSTVCLNLPAQLSVTPSCVTEGDNLFTVTWANQTANKVFASPNGSTGVPTFRKVVGADVTDNTLGLNKLAQVGGFFVLANPTGSTGDVQAVGLGNAFAFDAGTGQVRTVAYTGDVTIAANATATVLATVNSNVGAFGAASKTLVITVNAKGLVTAAAETPIAITSSQVSGLAAVATSGSASDLGTGTLPDARLSAVGTAGTYTVVTTDAKGRVSAGAVATLTAGTGLTGGGTLDASRTVGFAAIGDGNLLGNISGGSAAPTAHTLSAYVNALLSPSTGDLFVWSSGVLAKLSPGSANQAVVSNGAAALPSYKTASVGGTGTVSGSYDCAGNFSGTITGLTIVWT